MQKRRMLCQKKAIYHCVRHIFGRWHFQIIKTHFLLRRILRSAKRSVALMKGLLMSFYFGLAGPCHRGPPQSLSPNALLYGHCALRELVVA